MTLMWWESPWRCEQGGTPRGQHFNQITLASLLRTDSRWAGTEWGDYRGGHGGRTGESCRGWNSVVAVRLRAIAGVGASLGRELIAFSGVQCWVGETVSTRHQGFRPE